MDVDKLEQKCYIISQLTNRVVKPGDSHWQLKIFGPAQAVAWEFPKKRDGWGVVTPTHSFFSEFSTLG